MESWRGKQPCMGAILILSVFWSADAHSVSLQIQANCRTGPPIFLPFSADNIVLDDFLPTYSRVYVDLGVPEVVQHPTVFAKYSEVKFFEHFVLCWHFCLTSFLNSEQNNYISMASPSITSRLKVPGPPVYYACSIYKGESGQTIDVYRAPWGPFSMEGKFGGNY